MGAARGTRLGGEGLTRTIRPAVASLVVVAVFTMASAACTSRASRSTVSAGVLHGANVLLVTIDTLRADHLGAYGNRLGLTPTLDRFAREGVRFEVTRAHVPLTLPSHTTIMTALYPFTNGVRDNGTFRFDGAHATLASTLKAAGYSTGAFVGSFVLDARFGLNVGFDRYDDRMHGSGANLEVVQRSAEQVLEPAGQWILGAGDVGQPATPPRGSPWFAWVHLYDPHEPYTPPEPYASRYADDPYSGEVAYADAALGAFIEHLRSAGALDRTLVVLTSDHGESLGEHGERTHGLFAYDATLRVPFIVWASPAIAADTVTSPVRLVDVMPTVLDLLGVAAPPGLDGRSVRRLIGATELAPGEHSISYFEALNANLTRNWAPLNGVVDGSLKLIDLPDPELYDLASDPHETRNLYASQRDRARDLESRLDRLGGAARGAVKPTPMDPDAEARLRSLGYVVGSVAKPSRTFSSADDPKRLVHLNSALDEAAALWSRRDADAAIATLEAVVHERPDLTPAYERLAFMLEATGRGAQAVALLDSAAKNGHTDRSLLRALGSTLRDGGDLPRAARVLEALARDDPGDVQTADALGQTYARMNRARDAEALFKRVLAVSPNAGVTWNNLGAAYLMDGNTDEAITALSRAVALNPELAVAHNGLGVAYARRGDLDRARQEWTQALALRPGYPDAAANLQRVSR